MLLLLLLWSYNNNYINDDKNHSKIVYINKDKVENEIQLFNIILDNILYLIYKQKNYVTSVIKSPLSTSSSPTQLNNKSPKDNNENNEESVDNKSTSIIEDNNKTVNADTNDNISYNNNDNEDNNNNNDNNTNNNKNNLTNTSTNIVSPTVTTNISIDESNKNNNDEDEDEDDNDDISNSNTNGYDVNLAINTSMSNSNEPGKLNDNVVKITLFEKDINFDEAKIDSPLNVVQEEDSVQALFYMWDLFRKYYLDKFFPGIANHNVDLTQCIYRIYYYIIRY